MKREGSIDLNEAVQNPGKTLTFDVKTELPQEEDVDLLSPVSGTLQAVSTGSVLLIKGKFKVRCVFECARCAAPLERDIEFNMSDEFEIDGIPACYGSESANAKVIDEEPFHLFEKNALVTDKYIRQGLLTSLPYQPLCNDDWDTPCPSGDVLKEHQKETVGHPAMQALEKFRTEDRN